MEEKVCDQRLEGYLGKCFLFLCVICAGFSGESGFGEWLLFMVQQINSIFHTNIIETFCVVVVAASRIELSFHKIYSLGFSICFEIFFRWW